MNTYDIIDFEPELFLQQYWQKKPCIIRRLFPEFTDVIDVDTLAGLTMEPDVDSRIVSLDNGQWHVEQGPFDEDINDYCVGKWTLMVQGVDNYIEDTQSLIKRFSFIPYWRFDDLLVTYSVPGAGVGAHVDEYDVFIIQGMGQRRWQVGDKLYTDNQARFPHPKLQQVDSFTPIIDVVMLPGDVLYIPPKFPHKGETIKDCINYSVGFRAPNQSDLFQAVADGILTNDVSTKRFTDPSRQISNSPAALSNHDLLTLKQMLHQFIDTPDCDALLAEMLSKRHPCLDEPYRESEYQGADILALVNQGLTLCTSLGVKALYVEHQTQDDFVFYIHGDCYAVDAADRAYFESLFDRETLQLEKRDGLQFSSFKVIAQLVNDGYVDIAA